MEDLVRQLNEFAAYTSPTYRRFLERRAGAPEAPDAELLSVVALFADISGFSALAATLGAAGPGGAEQLSILLNQRFGRLVDLVHEHGGELVDFAGDAAIAFWPAEQPHAAHRAAACGLAIRDALEAEKTGGIAIRLRVGIGAGAVLSALVGGSEGRWHTLMAGEAWSEMLRADAVAQPGQVVLAGSVTRLLPLPGTGETLPAGCFRLDTLPPGPPPHVRQMRPDPSAAALSAGIPRAVRQRIDAGQQHWLAEFLTVSTLFVNVPELAYEDLAELDRLQRVTTAIQQVVHRFGGSVNRLLADDKGTVLIAAWGVPLHSYEDNAVRAVLAALALRESLQRLGVRAPMGITTGRAFAGTVGNARRRQYALVGDDINLAARLMQHAGHAILCDTATRTAARARVAFGASSRLRVKGRDVPVDVAAALGARERASGTAIIGRHAEQRVLTDALTDLASNGASGVLVIKGEPGIGKSALLSVFLRRAQSSRVRVLAGASESIDQLSPYRAWRGVFDSLLGLDGDDDAEQRRRRVTELIGVDPVARYLPLVSDALGLGLAPSELTSTMSDNARTEGAHSLLVRLFECAAGGDPVAFVLEDAHWMDSFSWSLALALHRNSSPKLLVVVLRPLSPEDMTADARRLIAHEETRTIDLTVLSGDEALALACRRLDVDALPDAVAALIRTRGEGHPLFTEQLVRSLVERGVIQVEHHECRASPDFVIPEFPETVQGLIRSRIDLLSAGEQLTLKVASVLGQAIDRAGVAAVHPVLGSGDIEPQLARMAGLDLLEESETGHATGTGSGMARSYAFKHAIIREVAYGTLALAQRRELHQAAAEWYERSLSDRTHVYVVLASHWSEAGVLDKALDYLDLACVQAQSAGNYRETVTLATQALAIAERAPGLATPVRCAAWLRRAGQASHSLGRLGDARTYLERAAALLGSPIPATPSRQAAGMLASALGLWMRSAARRRRLEPADADHARLYEAATIVNAASPIYYTQRDTLRTAYALVRLLDLADRLAPTDLLAKASAEIAFLWGYVGVHRKADRLFERGLALAEMLRLPRSSARILFSWSVFDLGRGAFAQGTARVRRSVAIYRELGEHHLRRDSELVEAYLGTFTDDWDNAAARYQRMLAESSESDSLVHVAWACSGLAKIRFHQGRFPEALEFISVGLPAARDSNDNVTEMVLLARRAAARTRTGDLPGAAEDVEAVAAATDPKATPSAFLLTESYVSLADAALTLAVTSAAREEMLRAAARACAALDRSARVFSAVKPAARHWRALLAEVSRSPVTPRAR